ncbi:hypothetical protein I317_00825 [Kwoniella heveanensis CBS 569]|uniref:Uncharacterized protein n=1 Tax=Kwoniella heveanensis BCC8398 TaxID=1296120 RepID=A0A1B9GPD2_9TREE|nr:hypothetical protein I316_05484 [Kwoniella heveanensis BCC8398]OCF45302.1 hypothetical protein I317_00825 [Kwoniella heveanensis CBS 569]
MAASSSLAPRESTTGIQRGTGSVLSPGQANMWIQSQSHIRSQNQGSSRIPSGPGGIADKDADEASLELNAKSDVVSPISSSGHGVPGREIGSTISRLSEPRDIVMASASVGGVADADAEKSSDLGIGLEEPGPDYLGLDIGGVEDEFWEGVLLNGDELDE